jgi:hypothetical protein
MTEPDQTPTLNAPAASEQAPTRPMEPVPTSSNGAQATGAAETTPTPPPTAPATGAAETTPTPPPASPAVIPPAPARGSTARPGVALATSKWMIIHPHVSFFSWLADKQGPAELPPEARLARYRKESPRLFQICVTLDLLVLFVVTGILVFAMAAILYKAIWGVV